MNRLDSLPIAVEPLDQPCAPAKQLDILSPFFAAVGAKVFPTALGGCARCTLDL